MLTKDNRPQRRDKKWRNRADLLSVSVRVLHLQRKQGNLLGIKAASVVIFNQNSFNAKQEINRFILCKRKCRKKNQIGKSTIRLVNEYQSQSLFQYHHKKKKKKYTIYIKIYTIQTSISTQT